MAPSPTPDARETERSSAANTSQTCQQVPQPTNAAMFVQSSKHDSSEAEADSLGLRNLSESFQQYIDDVAQPGYHQALKSILNFDNGVPITQCICLGLGNFNIVANKKGDPRSDYRHTSLHQLAVLTVLLQIMAEKHTIQETYFQDPVFTEVEKGFLRSLGYTVLEDPAACEQMSAETFLFAPFLCYDVAASALMVAFPALYIGNGPAKCLRFRRLYHNHPQPEIQKIIIRTFERFRNAIVDGEPLPSFDQQSWAKDTTVHWLLPTLARHDEKKGLHSGTEHRIG